MPELPILRVGDKVTFTIAVRDIFATPVDVIVNPANKGLSHGGGLAEIISRMAGDRLDKECDALVEREGVLATSDAVITTAGLLDFAAVIHAVGPVMGSGNELEKLEHTIQNVLTIAEQANQDDNNPVSINSVAFPMISTGVYCVPKEICALAFANVMKRYLHSNDENRIKDIWLCVGMDDFDVFAGYFDTEPRAAKQALLETDDAVAIEINEEELLKDDNKDIDDWFH